MNPPSTPFSFKAFFVHLDHLIFMQTWPWWAAGLGIGLTALGLAWFTGKRLGVTGGYEDACSMMTKDPSFHESPFRWKLWFILGLPFGGALANAGHWNWSFLYGRLDALTFGNLFGKILILIVSGFLIGYGARWAGGCPSGNTLMGVSLGSKMSILATVAFLAAGMVVANILYKGF